MRRGESDRIAKPLRGEWVSGNYFSTFGVGAFAGRTIQPSDDQPSAPPVVMLSYRAWQQEYGSDPSIVGSTMIIDGHPFTLVGITPPGFFGETLRGNPAEIWLPINTEPIFRGQESFLPHFQAWLRVIGRLRPGATTDGVAARLTNELRLWLANDADFPAEWKSGLKDSLPKQNIKIVPGGTGVGLMKENYGENLRILLAVCSLVLLIACANIANLLLARGASRRAQTSVRLALGASRNRLIRQTLTESLVLSVFGGVLGLLVAFLGVKAIVALVFQSARNVPISAAPSLAVLGFAFGITLLTGVLFGVAPAWFTSHADPAEALRGANRSTRDRSSTSAKSVGCHSSHVVGRSARRRRPPHPQPHQDAAPELRLRSREPGHPEFDRSILHVLETQTRRHVSRTAGPPLAHSRSRKRRPHSVRSAAGQLGRDCHPAGPRHA